MAATVIVHANHPMQCCWDDAANLCLSVLVPAVEAFSKQGVNGLPDGMLLDPWNEEAVLQAQQASALSAQEFFVSSRANCASPLSA